MSMRVTIDLFDLGSIYVHASGPYSPDVMNDPCARATEQVSAVVLARVAHGQLVDGVADLTPDDDTDEAPA